MTKLPGLDKAARDRAQGEAMAREALTKAVADRDAAQAALNEADKELAARLVQVRDSKLLTPAQMVAIVGKERRATMYRIFAQADKAEAGTT